MKTYILLFLLFTALLFAVEPGVAEVTNPAAHQTALASWYSVRSSLKEGNNAIMANGERLNDVKYTCASWDYAFGTTLEIVNCENSKKVLVEVTDRGPAKRLYRKGRTIDLSKAAFRSIADLNKGIIQVKVIPRLPFRLSAKF